MKKRYLFMLLVIVMLVSALVGCQTTPDDKNSPDDPRPPLSGDGDSTTDNPPVDDAPTKPFEEVEDIMNTVEPYITKYADADAAAAWISKHILNTDTPPVTFMADGIASDMLTWKKAYKKAETVTDFPDEAPFIRVLQPITYVCAEKNIRIELTVTTYPGYPVVEYDGTLYNDATGNSCTLSELQAIDERIDLQNSVHILHAMKGSIYGTTLIPGTDFAPLKYSRLDGEGVTLSVTTGRPSETYLPYFNLENPEYNTGTIAILNWQGSWKANFTEDDQGVRFRAGQYETNFVLQNEESARFPGMVLLFYKGDSMNGQNVYRRWIYQCNLFREQGKHMKNTNVLVCSTTCNEEDDLKSMEMYDNTGLTALIDKFNIDAGWYPTDGKGWSYTGNWYPDEDNYPNGLAPIGEAANDLGLDFALWIEPERLYKGTEMAEDMKDSLIALAPDLSILLGDDIPDGQLCLLNYANEEAVNYVVDMIDRSIKKYGVDQYRQDYNIQPGLYWSAMDGHEAGKLGITRTGLTENHACTGYLTVWSRLQELNPGMYYDACATGGTRYDLSTMRYSFLHTRSDEWANIENAQSQAYGSSMWFLYCGTGFTDLSTYDVRSHISNSIGVGITHETSAPALEGALEEWLDLAAYLMYDYYPLTGYAGTSDKTMSMQYDSPEDGKGMFITYFRVKDALTLCPRGLDPNAEYRIWNRDDRKNTETVMTGAEIMAGMTLKSNGRTAVVYEYCLVDGQNTEEFQSQSVATGLGSTDFDPSTINGTTDIQVDIPTVNAKYSPSGMSDEELRAKYSIEGDNKIAFVGNDYMSAGGIYAISKNIYDGLQRNPFNQVNGWVSLDKTKIAIELLGAWYPYTQWDSMVFAQQPYVKEIEGTYFMWLTNTAGLGDTDGGWSNWDLRIQWVDAQGNTMISDSFTIHVEGKKEERIQYYAVSESIPSDYIYRIDEEIFGSFPYTGYGTQLDGEIWYEIDMTKCGYIATSVRKTPDEKQSIASQMSLFNESDDVQLYTLYRDGEYFLYYKNAAFRGGRDVLAWINANGEYCAQTFLVN